MAKGKIRNCKVTFNQFNKYKADYKGMGRCVLGIIKTICENDPITTKKDGITFYVSRGWNGHLQDSNFYYFCDAAKKNFDIDVQLLN